uniref:Copine-8 n=1 Tax=Aceria tosichella TaxID=561515 RepID=A0A6G1SD13_9ACAR
MSSHHHYSAPTEVDLQQQQQQAAEQTTSLVELSISCKDLPDCDIVTKSDPQVIVYMLDLSGKDKQCEIGRTEVIQDNLNPKFAKKILLQYHFEQIQHLRFEVFDIDPVGGNDFLGGLNTTLADIVAARSSTFKQPLVGGPRKRPGFLVVDVEELTSCKQVATFDLSATDLPSSFCGLLAPTSSVYIYRSNENGTLTIVYRSPSVRRDCNPKYRTFTQKLVTLCNGDLDRNIRFELMDQNLNMERQLGFFETTINSLKSGGRQQQTQVFDLLNQKSSNRSAQPSESKIALSNFKIINQATFLDYIRAGAQIHFVIAIDFTASNGDPNYPDSLHYLDPMGRKMNPYEQALLSVGNIIKPYDTQGLFAGFGFGAKLLGPNRPPSHFFPLNGNEQHPYVTSIDDLLIAYRSKLKNVILSGPTNFAPCIAHCNNIANQYENGDHYFVLLIVTDGIISDMMQTKRAIVEASKSPMSIIICGVGDADFSAMDELDSDDVVMRVDGKSAERDIVQFVPMNKFTPQSYGPSARASSYKTNSLELQRLLAEEVLREIPDQLTGYMLSHGFHPELTYTTD